METWTGQLKAKFLLSKIKVSVDLVGHLLRLVVFNLSIFSKMKLYIFLSNSLWTVVDHMEIMDAMEGDVLQL